MNSRDRGSWGFCRSCTATVSLPMCQCILLLRTKKWERNRFHLPFNTIIKKKKIHPLHYYKVLILTTQHVRVQTWIIVTVQQTTILGQSGNSTRNTWKFVKCGAGDGRRRSVGPVVWKMKKYCKKKKKVKEDRNVMHVTKHRKVNWICHILHRNCFLIHVT